MIKDMSTRGLKVGGKEGSQVHMKDLGLFIREACKVSPPDKVTIYSPHTFYLRLWRLEAISNVDRGK